MTAAVARIEQIIAEYGLDDLISPVAVAGWSEGFVANDGRLIRRPPHSDEMRTVPGRGAGPHTLTTRRGEGPSVWIWDGEGPIADAVEVARTAGATYLRARPCEGDDGEQGRWEDVEIVPHCTDPSGYRRPTEPDPTWGGKVVVL